MLPCLIDHRVSFEGSKSQSEKKVGNWLVGVGWRWDVLPSHIYCHILMLVLFIRRTIERHPIVFEVIEEIGDSHT